VTRRLSGPVGFATRLHRSGASSIWASRRGFADLGLRLTGLRRSGLRGGLRDEAVCGFAGFAGFAGFVVFLL
jgi:hypothetical protein